MKDIWLLGMGYLGLPLAQQLAKEGFSIIASSRQARKQPFPFAYQPLDIGKVKDISSEFSAKNWVCLLPPSCAENYVSFMSHYLQAAQRVQVQHIVLASSISVYGNANRDCYPATTVQPESSSAHKMVAAEKILLDSSIPNISIVRLGGLFSADRHPIVSLSRRGLVSEAQQQVNMLSKQDAIESLAQAIYQPQGKVIINAVMPEHPSKRAFYQQAADELSLPMPQFIDGQNGQGKRVHAGTFVIES